jgi:hypothetical protein
MPDGARDLRSRRRLHSVVFADPEKALTAVGALRQAGFRIHDVHTPFPVHGMAEAMGLPETRLSYATLLGACVGLASAWAIQVWTHAFDWPLVIGGKDNLALPALVPVAFELAVLFAAFATVAALIVRRRLLPRSAPEHQPRPDVTDDRFVVLVEESDAAFSPAVFQRVTHALAPEEVVLGWRTY